MLVSTILLQSSLLLNSFMCSRCCVYQRHIKLFSPVGEVHPKENDTRR